MGKLPASLRVEIPPRSPQEAFISADRRNPSSRCQPPHLWIARPGQKINCLEIGKKKKTQKTVDSGHREGLRKRRLSQGKRKPCSAGAPDPRQQIRVICSASGLVFKYKKDAGLELKRGGVGGGRGRRLRAKCPLIYIGSFTGVPKWGVGRNPNKKFPFVCLCFAMEIYV